VDGLDEFNEKHEDLIQAIEKFSTESNVKFCVASRPWNVFERAFGDESLRKIYLQDLKQARYSNFFEDTLQSRPDFQTACEEDPSANKLIGEIIEKSNGVFFWLVLVVRSLIEGLINDNRLMDLRMRLRSFPSDLNHFFAHIYDVFGYYLPSSDGTWLSGYSLLADQTLSTQFSVYGCRGRKTRLLSTNDAYGHFPRR
jgi:hypothetical protein